MSIKNIWQYSSDGRSIYGPEEFENMTVIKVNRTCTAAPSQWDGWTDDNRKVYIRFRRGWLSINVGDVGDDSEFAGVGGNLVYNQQIGNEFNSYLSYKELALCTMGFIVWPDKENIECST